MYCGCFGGYYLTTLIAFRCYSDWPFGYIHNSTRHAGTRPCPKKGSIAISRYIRLSPSLSRYSSILPSYRPIASPTTQRCISSVPPQHSQERSISFHQSPHCLRMSLLLRNLRRLSAGCIFNSKALQLILTSEAIIVILAISFGIPLKPQQGGVQSG